MEVALIGYGKMGQALDQMAQEMGHKVVARISPQLVIDRQKGHFDKISKEALEAVDVCIDFSRPEAVLKNIEAVLALKKPLVVGTTGWYEGLPQVEAWVKKSGVGLVYAANFSLGVTLFLHLLSLAGTLVGSREEYDVGGVEYHHNKKVDSPSGTAQRIAETLIRTIPRKSEAVYNRLNSQIEPHQIHFSSVRCGSIPGTHEVVFDSVGDTITLTHTARNRQGFARGALTAAEWIAKRSGCYHFSEIAKEVLYGS